MTTNKPTIVIKLFLSTEERLSFEGRGTMCVPLSGAEIADLRSALTDQAMFIELMAQELIKAHVGMESRNASEEEKIGVATLIECADRGRSAVEIARTLLGRAVFVSDVDKETLQ